MENLNLNKITKKLRRFFKGRKEIKFAYLFGSQLKKPTKISDIDIAVYVDNEVLKNKKYPFGYKACLITDLMEILNTENIHVVLLNDDISPLVAHRATWMGKLIFSRDEKTRINYQVRIFNEYIDTEKIRRIGAEYLGKRILAGKFAKL